MERLFLDMKVIKKKHKKCNSETHTRNHSGDDTKKGNTGKNQGLCRGHERLEGCLFIGWSPSIKVKGTDWMILERNCLYNMVRGPISHFLCDRVQGEV